MRYYHNLGWDCIGGRMEVALRCCCRCNRNAKCVRCACAKNSKSCFSCFPGDHGKCQNRRLNNDTLASRLSCSRTAHCSSQPHPPVPVSVHTSRVHSCSSFVFHPGVGSSDINQCLSHTKHAKLFPSICPASCFPYLSHHCSLQ